jgi:hypothetical protein
MGNLLVQLQTSRAVQKLAVESSVMEVSQCVRQWPPTAVIRAHLASFVWVALRSMGKATQ